MVTCSPPPLFGRGCAYCTCIQYYHVILCAPLQVRDINDLGHPICDNLRAGDWMAVYTINRLRLYEGTKAMADSIGLIFSQISKLPRYLIPCYFEAVVTTTYTLLTQAAVAKMGRYGVSATSRDGCPLWLGLGHNQD